MKIAIINGPNMNLLKIREPEIYGNITLEEIKNNLDDLAVQLSCELVHYQSNYEGAIVDFIHQYMNEISGVIINPAGLSTTGYCILDALDSIHIPYIEVHMSNIFARGERHSKTIFQENAIGFVTGLKEDVYELALRGLVSYLRKRI